MGTVALLFGLTIYIRPNDHNPPYVHVWFGEYKSKFSTLTGKIMSGSIPSTKEKIVEEFISCYRDELLKMWNSKTYDMLEKK